MWPKIIIKKAKVQKICTSTSIYLTLITGINYVCVKKLALPVPALFASTDFKEFHFH